MMMGCIQGMRVTVRQKGSLDTWPEADDGFLADIASGEALDDEEEGSMDADDASSSAITTGPVSGQYL